VLLYIVSVVSVLVNLATFLVVSGILFAFFVLQIVYCWPMSVAMCLPCVSEW
jgi:hypothetical protein